MLCRMGILVVFVACAGCQCIKLFHETARDDRQAFRHRIDMKHPQGLK